MNAIGFVLAAAGVIVVYEAAKNLHVLGGTLATANAAGGPSASAQSGNASDWGVQLSGDQIASLLCQAGANKQEVSILTQIALRESSGYTQIPALTPGDPYQGEWGGLWQDIPPTASSIGLAPGASPAQQAAANLGLFRRNHGSDWTGGGRYPLPAPGPYEGSC